MTADNCWICVEWERCWTVDDQGSHRDNADKEMIKQFDELNFKLTDLKEMIHKLDELSYAFRYPVKNDGVTPNFDTKDVADKNDVLNFKTMLSLDLKFYAIPICTHPQVL